MGVRGFCKFYRCISEMNNHNMIKLSELSKSTGKLIVVDASGLLNKKCIGMALHGITYNRKDGTPANHIHVIYNFVLKVMKLGFNPIFIFDGKPPCEKQKTIEKRIEEKEKINADGKQNTRLSRKQFDECRKILELMGVPYCNSPSEADSQCAAIAAYYTDICAGIVSDDTDMLVYGGRTIRILKDFDLNKNTTVQINSLDVMREMLTRANTIKNVSKITHENFIDFSTLMGSDYGDVLSRKIDRDNLFRTFVENDFDVVKTICHYQTCAEDANRSIVLWTRIRNIYMYSEVYHPKNIDIKMKQPNITGLTNYLSDVNGFSENNVASSIKKSCLLFRNIL